MSESHPIPIGAKVRPTKRKTKSKMLPVPGSPLWEVLAKVEAAHFRTEHDTGANDCARLVWNVLRSHLGLPWLDRKHFPKWDGAKYAMPADSTLLVNIKNSRQLSAVLAGIRRDMSAKAKAHL